MRHFLTLILSSIFIHGCDVSERGFRFTAVYEAAQSGYEIHVVSKGLVKAGDDLANSAFAAAVICPARASGGKMLQLTLTVQPRQWIKVDCEQLGIHSEDLNWKTSESVLASMLRKSGYDSLAPDEITGSVRVMLNALSGPKGVILDGQIKSLRVLSTKIDYGYDVSTSDPPAKWIVVSEYPVCSTL